MLRAPREWYDTIPVGRILNRFTSDFNIADSRVANVLGSGFSQALEALCIIIIGLLVSPYVIPFALLLLLTAGITAHLYLGAAREVKRLESNSKSQIFEQFQSVLAGISTIRAFDKGQEYTSRSAFDRNRAPIFARWGRFTDGGNRMWDEIDTFSKAQHTNWLFNRWLQFRLALIGTFMTIIIAFAVVSLQDIDAGLAGFALAFSLQYTLAIVFTVQQYANAEVDMVSSTFLASADGNVQLTVG